MKLVRSHYVIVQTPLQSTFEYVSDLTRHPEWSGGLKIEAVTSSAVHVGKEYVSHGEVAVQKARPNKVQVTEYEPPYTYGFVAKDPDFGDVSHVFTFTAQDGGTLVTRTMTVSLKPFLAFLFRFFIYPLIGKPSMDKSLARLKAKLEELDTVL